jgi:cation diffusion facilitator family transporter
VSPPKNKLLIAGDSGSRTATVLALQACVPSSPDRRLLTLYAAIAANLAIAITKFLAAVVTQSGAMFSEGLHSVIDTGDGLLLLLGIHLSRRPADARHPYGYGHQIYFWSMVVAMVIFGIGGGISIYTGIRHLMSPHAIESSWWAYGVLAAAFIFEGISWLVAMREFRRVRGRRTSWEAIQHSKDPTTFIVVLEDSAALLGILIAAAGLALSHLLDTPVFDAIASILIGVLLGTVAIVLARETWSLLLGEAAAPELVDSIRTLALAQPGVVDAHSPRTMHLGPDLVHVDLDLRVDPTLTAADILATSRSLEAAVRERHPRVQRVSLRFPAWT